MALFDALTGNAGHQAAAQTRNALGAIVPNLASTGQDAYGAANNYLQTGFRNANSDLGTGYAIANNAVNQGASGALGYLQSGQQGAFNQLGQARNDLTAGGGAYAPLSALASQYGQGAGLYADSLGINGPQGNANAVSAFQAGPGYQFAFDQGTEALNRQANLGGISGNTLRDTFKFGQGLGNQEYGNWQNRLSAYNPLQLSATQGAAAGNQANNQGLANLGVAGANLANTGGQNQAQVASGQGNTLADLARSYYGGLGVLETGQGGALANNAIGGAQNYQNQFQSGLRDWNNTYAQDAQTSNNASANAIGLGLSLANLGGKAYGGLGGFSGIKNMFG